MSFDLPSFASFPPAARIIMIILLIMAAALVVISALTAVRSLKTSSAPKYAKRIPIFFGASLAIILAFTFFIHANATAVKTMLAEAARQTNLLARILTSTQINGTIPEPTTEVYVAEDISKPAQSTSESTKSSTKSSTTTHSSRKKPTPTATPTPKPRK